MGGTKRRMAGKVISNTRKNIKERTDLSLIRTDEWKKYFQKLHLEERHAYKKGVNKMLENDTGYRNRN